MEMYELILLSLKQNASSVFFYLIMYMSGNNEGIQLQGQVTARTRMSIWGAQDVSSIIYYLPPLSIQSAFEICPKFIIWVLITPAVLCNKDILCQVNVTL